MNKEILVIQAILEAGKEGSEKGWLSLSVYGPEQGPSH